MLTEYHAVMVDETGCEFGADVRAESRDEAYDKLRENYPESRCVQLESPQDAADRKLRIYAAVCDEYDEYPIYDEEEW